MTVEPRSGAEMIIDVTAEPHRVNRKPAHQRFALRPVVVRPRIGIRMPVLARVGQEFGVTWDGPQEATVSAHVEGAGVSLEKTGPAAGGFLVRPEQPGLMMVNFVVRDPYADRSVTRRVLVWRERIGIKIDYTSSPVPGEAVNIVWHVNGGKKYWLEARGESHEVKRVGAAQMVFGAMPETLRLVAKGTNHTRSKTIRIEPNIFGEGVQS
jgi:hypothetical protein